MSTINNKSISPLTYEQVLEAKDQMESKIKAAIKEFEDASNIPLGIQYGYFENTKCGQVWTLPVPGQDEVQIFYNYKLDNDWNVVIED